MEGVASPGHAGAGASVLSGAASLESAATGSAPGAGGAAALAAAAAADPAEGVDEHMPKPRATPVLEDLFFDETLSDVERIVRYGKSPLPLQRLVHARMLAQTAAREGCVVGSGRAWPRMHQPP